MQRTGQKGCTQLIHCCHERNHSKLEEECMSEVVDEDEEEDEEEGVRRDQEWWNSRWIGKLQSWMVFWFMTWPWGRKDSRTACLSEASRVRTFRGEVSVIWDSMSFHCGPGIYGWFISNQHFISVCLPSFSPFLNPTEVFLSTWQWQSRWPNPLYIRGEICSSQWMRHVMTQERNLKLDHFWRCVSAIQKNSKPVGYRTAPPLGEWTNLHTHHVISRSVVISFMQFPYCA